MEPLIGQAFSIVSAKYPGVKATLQLDGLIPIKALKHQIESLFVQLLDNSFKYARPEEIPYITITSSVLPYNSLADKPGQYRYKNYVQILYTDNSQGFDEKYKHCQHGAEFA